MAGFVFHLVVGEAERGETGGGVALEAERVTGLGGGGAVVAPAVGLDDEAEVRPEEVDLEFVDDLFGEGRRQASRGGDRTEEEFEFVVGEAEGVLVENLTEETDSRLARVFVGRAPESIRVDDIPLVGLVDGPLEAVGTQYRRQVDERANWLGKGNVPANRDVLGAEGRSTPNAETRPAVLTTAADADLGEVSMLLAEFPERGGTAVAEQCVGVAGKHRRHPTPLPFQLSSPDGVDTTLDQVQASGA